MVTDPTVLNGPTIGNEPAVSASQVEPADVIKWSHHATTAITAWLAQRPWLAAIAVATLAAGHLIRSPY
jgi:hypothetical protein